MGIGPSKKEFTDLMEQMGWGVTYVITVANLETWADQAADGIHAKSTMKSHERGIKKILDKWQNAPSTLMAELEDEDVEEGNDVDELLMYLEDNDNSLMHLALQRRYTSLQAAARKFLLANSASLVDFYNAKKSYEALRERKLYTCKYDCGFIGSWEECAAHETSCTARKPQDDLDESRAIDTRRNIKF